MGPEHLDVGVALPALDGPADEGFLPLPDRTRADGVLELEDKPRTNGFQDRRRATFLAVLRIREVDVLARVDVRHGAAARNRGHAIGEQVAAGGQDPGRARAPDELVGADEDRVLVIQLGVVAGAVRGELDVHVRSRRPEVPERAGAEAVEQDRDRARVADDPGDVRRRREAADLQPAPGMASKLPFERREVDPSVGILGNRHQIGDGFAPRQLVGVVLVRPDEHDRAIGLGNPGQEVVAIVEICRQADVQHVDELVDRPGRS